MVPMTCVVGSRYKWYRCAGESHRGRRLGVRWCGWCGLCCHPFRHLRHLWQLTFRAVAKAPTGPMVHE